MLIIENLDSYDVLYFQHLNQQQIVTNILIPTNTSIDKYHKILIKDGYAFIQLDSGIYVYPAQYGSVLTTSFIFPSYSNMEVGFSVSNNMLIYAFGTQIYFFNIVKGDFVTLKNLTYT